MLAWAASRCVQPQGLQQRLDHDAEPVADAEYGHAPKRAETGLLVGEAARYAEQAGGGLYVACGLRAEPFQSVCVQVTASVSG